MTCMHTMLTGTSRSYSLLNKHINEGFFFFNLFLGYDENPIREITSAKLQVDSTSKQATKYLHI